jgi:uncharacterized protein (TIGR03083 family)
MEPTDRVRKNDLLAIIRADRARFDEILDTVPPELLTEPILPGGWTVKDVLAHIAWGDHEGVGMMRARALVGSPLWDRPQDDRNEAVVRENRSRPLDEVMADYRSAFAEYMSAMEQLTEEDLNEPGHFSGLAERIPGWLPWRVLYDPHHYRDHGDTIREALGARPPAST